MIKIPISKAAPRLQQLFESVTESRLPIQLTGRNTSAVLVAWDDWRAIEQTLYRLSGPKRKRRPGIEKLA